MKRGLFSAFFLAWALCAAAPAVAQRAPAQTGIQPLDRLLPEIRRQHPGRFYDAEGPTYGPDGDPHYHLKWMTPGGRVIWLDTDARNGRVLRSSPGRDNFGPPGHDRGSFRGVPPGYESPGGPGARDPYEDRYRSRFGGQFETRQGHDWHGPRWGGPHAGDFGHRGGGRGGGHGRGHR